MPAKLTVSYRKTLGLPNFSSHCYAVEITQDVEDVAQARAEADKLYELLQGAVDEKLKIVGFVPTDRSYGRLPLPSGNEELPPGDSAALPDGHRQWKCTDAQWALITDFVSQRGLTGEVVDQLAMELYQVRVRALKPGPAARFIDELMKRHGESIVVLD